MRGFTLIELLIVIAIIGILVSIALPRFQSARTLSLDTKVRSELEAASKRAAIEESKSLTYDIVCGTNGFSQASSIADIVTSLESFASTTVTCNSATGGFALSVPLSDVLHWCVDSTGTRKEIAAALGSGELVCP